MTGRTNVTPNFAWEDEAVLHVTLVMSRKQRASLLLSSKILSCVIGIGHVLSNLEAANEAFRQAYPASYMQHSLIIRTKIFWTIERAKDRRAEIGTESPLLRWRRRFVLSSESTCWNGHGRL